MVFGTRQLDDYRPVLEQVASDLEDSGITALVSQNIRRDALQKFSYVSPMAACGAYFDIDAGAAPREGLVSDTLVILIRVIHALAIAMGIHFSVDIVAANLKILDNLLPTASTSMQRDIRQGKKSEIDGLVYEVLRLAKTYQVPVPTYEMIAAKFGFRIE